MLYVLSKASIDCNQVISRQPCFLFHLRSFPTFVKRACLLLQNLPNVRQSGNAEVANSYRPNAICIWQKPSRMSCVHVCISTLVTYQRLAFIRHQKLRSNMKKLMQVAFLTMSHISLEKSLHLSAFCMTSPHNAFAYLSGMCQVAIIRTPWVVFMYVEL